MPFSELGLSEKVVQAVAASGYTEPTPIQAQAIPHVLARRDVLGIAQTGTGKTAAFTLPMLTLLETGRARARMPRTLILEPTRELAAQVEESFDRYGVNHRLNVALLIGGVSFGDQDMKITRGADVVIATPGRLLDHFERGKLLLTGIELLVIDEADRMLDMGFIPDIERIVKLVPFTRQTLFFSATMPPEIQRLSDSFLHNPVKVEVAKPASTVATTTQRLVRVGREPHEKRERLRDLIRTTPDFKNAIIFCNRKREVATLQRSLARHRLQCGGAAWRPRPARSHGGARQLPQRRGAAPRRERRRGPRPRHPGREPRLQLRLPASRRGLCPPDRPHRPRRALGRGLHAGRAGRREIPRRDREADRTADPLGRVRSRRRLPPSPTNAADAAAASARRAAGAAASAPAPAAVAKPAPRPKRRRERPRNAATSARPATARRGPSGRRRKSARSIARPSAGPSGRAILIAANVRASAIPNSAGSPTATPSASSASATTSRPSCCGRWPTRPRSSATADSAQPRRRGFFFAAAERRAASRARRPQPAASSGSSRAESGTRQ